MACSTSSVAISRADFDRLKKEHADFRDDAAVIRVVLTAAEAGVGLLGIAMGALQDDSLVRLMTMIGGAAATLDAAARAKSI